MPITLRSALVKIKGNNGEYTSVDVVANESTDAILGRLEDKEAELEAAIVAKGEETLDSIPDSYEELQEEIDDLKGVKAVRYDEPQNLTDAQKEVAKANIGLDKIEGISDDVKTALLDCFRHVAWINQYGQMYYDALESALHTNNYPKITVSYAPGSHIVYDTDSLDSLKPYLTVLYFADETSSGTPISSTDYSLTGTLQKGTCKIDVFYNDLKASFVLDVETHVLYALTPETVFDGTSASDVNTEFKLLEQDIDFTILYKATIDVESQDDVSRVIYFTRYNDMGFGPNANLTQKTSDLTAGRSGDYRRVSNGSNWSVGEHVVIGAWSHVAGTNTWVSALKVDNAYGNARYNPGQYTYEKSDHPLFVGCGYTWSTDHYACYNRMKGTIHDFRILDYAMTQNELSQYVG